ncbi:hypothetical protein [Pseudoalteromonas denitrificans]|uniref:Uncharacterized protein n=1 Tax=Pseudoalteromonas denitrificans DSM 6059 TaxID=1123010 RepID=A0A1I1ILT6_9GAMM|nr:hypothetical protein [Pseudoalteromonas denitrificans]SFC36662.1 hypothetical protein SAMN02745724_01513 [Pseudoalteromonas denitrificans DSM 6059]
MKVKNKRSTNDHLTFPSGRTIKRCKEDAKELRKASKDTDNYISYNNALNLISNKNGLDMLWDKAINHIVSSQKEYSELEDPSTFNWLMGQLKNKHSHHKKAVHQQFKQNGKLTLPDGEGGFVDVSPHKQDKSGLLITEEVARLVEADIEQLGGLENLKGFDDGNVQLIYEKPNSTSHLAYEFHVRADGVIHYFCRCLPWAGYEAELHARGYDITNVGHGTRSADTALHWTGFTFWHRMLELREC